MCWSDEQIPNEGLLRSILADEDLHPYVWSNWPGDIYDAHSYAYHKVISQHRWSSWVTGRCCTWCHSRQARCCLLGSPSVFTLCTFHWSISLIRGLLQDARQALGSPPIITVARSPGRMQSSSLSSNSILKFPQKKSVPLRLSYFQS